jgi:hypothetical protein
MLDNYVYEFICCEELRELFKQTPSKLYQVELFNQLVTALRNPATLTELPINHSRLPSSDGRLQLTREDYLKYRIPKLHPVDEFLETFL